MKGKILVVDDNDLVRAACSELLGEAGYSVQTAVNGADAMDKLEDSVYDLVITDLQMPKLDGLSLYLHARKEHLYLKDRFLFMTGNPWSHAVIPSVKIKVLKKPFTAQELLDSVKLFMQE